MIGVISKASEARAVREFFQLFKTPWEFYVPGSKYDLVIATREEIPRDLNTSALVIYHSQSIGFDDQIGVEAESSKTSDWVQWDCRDFPVYGDLTVFHSAGRRLLNRRKTSEVVGAILEGLERPTVRIGFDLFYEVGFLLSQGQPPENARFPTLELHISLLRTIILALGMPFVEVPPVPPGYDFMACLTHDVDFVGIREHKFDHTMWGFLYRSTVGSLLKTLAGKLPWSKCLQNWAAALSLPLVHLGLRHDFWLEFDRYAELERGLGSTFFFLPFKNVPGTLGSTAAPKRRAARYDVAEISEQVLNLVNNGCEVGLHGIDAWRNVQSAQAEQARIHDVAGQSDLGTRMHWLYWSESAPKILEEAGFAYDSTFGYNEAVGFRAGTTQPFSPSGAKRLLELPLNIQDSAMFYSDRMMLSEAEAMDACRELIHIMSSSGGALTVNWHTRSLSPERLWGNFYAELLKEIQTHRVWFGTAQEIVGWFQKRRAIRFEENGVRVALTSPAGRSEPSFTIRTYEPSLIPGKSAFSPCMSTYEDTLWSGEEALECRIDRVTSAG
jgi:hypothetical protein